MTNQNLNNQVEIIDGDNSIYEEESIPFAAEVWETLSSIDCSQHVKDKGDFTYLSWVWAWGILMENYPESKFTRLPITTYEDGTVEVEVMVVVARDDCEVTRAMWLPVMDFRNNAIPHPDSRQISDAFMRCWVKCIATLGLGHYIFAGEDIPREEDAKPIFRFKSGEKERIVVDVMKAIEEDSVDMLNDALKDYENEDPEVKKKVGFLFDKPTRDIIKKMKAEDPAQKEHIKDLLKNQGEE